MYVTVLMLVPGLVSAAIYCRAKGIPMASLGFLFHWLVSVFLVNAFVIGADVLRSHGTAPLESMFSAVALLTKYGALALLTAVALPYAVLLVESLFRKPGRHA